MCKNTQPPFAPGQRILRVVNSRWGKIGDIEHVFDLKQCKCGEWFVDIGHKEGVQFYSSVCGFCGHKEIIVDGTAWYAAKAFAPIHRASSNITKELAKDAIPETLDVIQQHVLS